MYGCPTQPALRHSSLSALALLLVNSYFLQLLVLLFAPILP